MPEATADREISVSRIIDAPRWKIWDVCTTAEHLGKWWGPSGFTITTTSFDFREGGEWIFLMHGPDGRDWPNHIVFTKIVEGERIEHDHGDQKTVHFQASLILEDQGGGTKVTLHSVFPTKEVRDRVVKEYRAIEGAKQNLERLEKYVGL